jgi:hypothetical protein
MIENAETSFEWRDGRRFVVRRLAPSRRCDRNNGDVYRSYGRLKPPKRRDPAAPTLGQLALEELKQAERDATPLGGWGGELLVSQSTEPAPPWPAPFRPEPPDWEAERVEREERERRGREAELEAEIVRRQEGALLEEEPGRHPPPTRTAS